MTSPALSRRGLREAWMSECDHHVKCGVSRETDPSLLTPQLLEWLPGPQAQLWEQLELQGRLTLETNRRFNLVSRRAPELQIQRNLLSGILLGLICLHVSRETDPPWVLLDAGSGSGVPGIPARLLLESAGVRPGLILLDSQVKKVDFLRRLVVDLQLEDARILEGRLEGSEMAELAAHGSDSRSWWLTSMALADLVQTQEWTRRIQDRLAGAFLIKGSRAQEELKAARRGGPWRELRVHRFLGRHREAVVLHFARKM